MRSDHPNRGLGTAYCRTETRIEEEIITKAALMALPEYSCSLPTGTTIGKRWRCATRPQGPRTEWKIGVLDVGADPNRVGIVWVWAVEKPWKPWETER